MKKKPKKESTRKKILEAAKKEFARKGFDGARMNIIASDAGVNSALLHYYYKNKENLYIEVLKKCIGAEYGDTLFRILELWELPHGQKLNAIIYLTVKLSMEGTDTDTYRIFSWEIAKSSNYLDLLIQDYNVPKMKQLMKTIEEGIRAGEFLKEDPFLVLFLIHSFIYSHAMRYKLLDHNNTMREYFSSSADEIYQFISRCIFKFLSPSELALKSFEMPGPLQKFLDDIVELVKKDQQGDLEEDIMEQISELSRKTRV